MTMLLPLLLAFATPPSEPEAAPAAPPALAPTESRPRPRPLGPVSSGGSVRGGAGLGLAIAGGVRMSQPNPSMLDPYDHDLLIVTAARKVALQIDYLRLIEQEGEDSVQDTVWYIRQDTTTALRDRHGVEVVEDAGGRAIVVVLSWIRQEESVYGVTIQTRRPGEDPRELETFECECIDSGLTKAVLQRLPAALAQLEEEAGPEPGPGPEPAEAGAEPIVTDPPGGEQRARQPALAPATESRPRPRPLGPVGSGGIVLGGAGLGVAIAGIVRMSQPNPSMLDPTNDELLVVTDTRIQGGIVLGAGLAVAAAGVAMLAIDLTVLRKRAARRLAVAPALSPSMAGLDLRLRFSLGRAGS